jgi:hypothetical protein
MQHAGGRVAQLTAVPAAGGARRRSGCRAEQVPLERLAEGGARVRLGRPGRGGDRPDGRIVEHWGVPDRFVVLAQTGVLDRLSRDVA